MRCSSDGSITQEPASSFFPLIFPDFKALVIVAVATPVAFAACPAVYFIPCTASSCTVSRRFMALLRKSYHERGVSSREGVIPGPKGLACDGIPAGMQPCHP